MNLKPLFILEMANNHKKSTSRGREIIDRYAEVTQSFKEFDFAIKFQRRSTSIIHADYQNCTDIPSIKRFKETQLTIEELDELFGYAKSKGFLITCTPFDEVAVQELQECNHTLDYVKVGSCSINDWALLNSVAKMNLPVIASVGGIEPHQIDKVVDFFKHRKIELSLLHCVGMYPTPQDCLCLDKIDELRSYGLRFGYSTHEAPTEMISSELAMAKHATIFEKHISLDDEHRNAYSMTPELYEAHLFGMRRAYKALQSNHWENEVLPKEIEKLSTFKRGAYLKNDIKSGRAVSEEDVYFAMPLQEDQVSAFDFDKYVKYQTSEDVKAHEPLIREDVGAFSIRKDVQNIHDRFVSQIKDYTKLPEGSVLEISHHCGVDNFYTHGMCVVTLINGEYCKKVLFVDRGQGNPIHHHNNKTETFLVARGGVCITVDNVPHHMEEGDMLTVKPGEKHSIWCGHEQTAIIEEISTKHEANDSYYVNDDINQNLDRKTCVYL